MPGGSPATFQSRVRVESLVLSEVLAAPREPSTTDQLRLDWIELENRSSLSVDLSGYQLIDETGRSEYVFGNDSILRPGERLVVSEQNQGNDESGFLFGLDRDGDSVVLLNDSGERVDAVSFGRQLPGYSLIQDEAGKWSLGVPTPGDSNVQASIAPLSALRINELMAAPLPGQNN